MITMASKPMLLSLVFVLLLSFEPSNTKSIVKKLPSFDGDLPFTLETGYIGVGKDEEVQLFYFFVESQRNPEKDPLLFYLPGGPGTSALFSFLYQMGPLVFNMETSWRDNITLELNPNAWTKTTNMIFLDIPANAGFSYAKTYEAIKSSDSLLVSYSYEFLRKWLLEHPRFVNNPLYISGISYMGIIIPLLTLDIYNGNERGITPTLNIKGYLILSPHSDKFLDYNSRIEFAHRFALISDDIYESTKINCRGNYMDVESSNTLCLNSLQHVDECISKINLEQILTPLCESNPGPPCKEDRKMYVTVWANDKAVQEALNVRPGTIEKWECESIHLDDTNYTEVYSEDIFSSIHYHEKLTTKDCQALIINADHDMVFPYISTENWINNLNLTIESPWKPWFLHNQVAGYQKTYVNNEYTLKYATCKGAGHSIPLHKPEECWFMVDTWLASHTHLSDS